MRREMSIIAPARTGSKERFLVFFWGFMLIDGMYRIIKNPLTTKKFALILCKIEIEANIWLYSGIPAD
jgi:hypothetical protein